MNIRTHGCMPSGSPLLCTAVLAALTSAGADVMAQSHRVFVNGQRMNDAQVAELARLSCVAIPDGAYWLNPATGAWGYAGNGQVQGVVGDRCGGGAGPVEATNQDGTLGPYPTMRRAEEVANGYRQRGYRAVSFHNGDGYYLRVSR